MTTRSQKRKESVKSKASSSTSTGVDFHKQPIFALPAMNPHSDLAGVPAANTNINGNHVESASNLKNSSSSPAADSHPATPVTVPAVKPLRCLTSNPVIRDIDALKSGELKVVSPAVLKFFGFPAGPVANLIFSDQKVAEFFNVPLPQSDAEVLDTVPVAGDSVQVARTETAALVPVSGQVPIQGPTSTVSPSSAVPLQNGNSIAQPSIAAAQTSQAAVGGLNVGGTSARPAPMAAYNGNSTTQTTPLASSWAGLFKSNRVLSDDTKMNPNVVGVSSEKVVLNDVDLDDDDKEKRSLIGFFNGQFPGINAIQRIVDDWSRKCSFHLHNSGWLVFTFEEEADCETVLKEGPYYAFNKPLVLKKIPEFFDFSDEAYSTAPVWIKLPNLPLRAWKKSALEKICSFLGTPLHIDLVTKEKNQKSFARCLVEMDVSKDLPNLVTCDLPSGKVLRQHVLYEEKPTFCSNCKKLGHETEDCYAKNNGVPSLYVARSKKVKDKKIENKQGSVGGAKQHVKGSAKVSSGHVAAPAAPVAAAVPSGAVDKCLGTVSRPIEAAGSLGGKSATRQSVLAPKEPVLNNKNGKKVEALAKDSGLVSANSFGPLANDKVGNWVDDAEASNALDINNNKKKTNDKKK